MKLQRLRVFSILPVFLFALYLSLKPHPLVQPAVQGASQSKQEITCVHQVRFFEPQLFFEGIKANKSREQASVLSNIRGGIIPHHLLASQILAEFFQILGGQDIETVILLGPNHYETGESKILTSACAWQSPVGQVEPDIAIIEKLTKNEVVTPDETVIDNEHSVSGLMPYIATFLPKAKVVPIVLSATLSKEELENLIANLALVTNQKTVVVASVDFSHNLDSAHAAANDQLTLRLIKQKNYNELMSLDNRYLDSPVCIVTLVSLMDSLGASQSRVLQNTNSGELYNQPNVAGTSYASILYY
ncbi:AmmeMemoRadiSam system protein B [Candidatus Beckwithbacteria bacterium]|nr:AmmeMemoRadiSam system protein B [Candidatus Beckwithbacteria bacterium]